MPLRLTIRSGVPRGASRTRMRDRVSSHIFFISSPLRPMMLPTFPTGTMRRNTQSPGHPSHLLSGGGAAAVVSVSVSAGGCAAETLSGESRFPAVPLWSGWAVAIVLRVYGGNETHRRLPLLLSFTVRFFFFCFWLMELLILKFKFIYFVFLLTFYFTLNPLYKF